MSAINSFEKFARTNLIRDIDLTAYMSEAGRASRQARVGLP
jgi:hypothetical protein